MASKRLLLETQPDACLDRPQATRRRVAATASDRCSVSDTSGSSEASTMRTASDGRTVTPGTDYTEPDDESSDVSTSSEEPSSESEDDEDGDEEASEDEDVENFNDGEPSERVTLRGVPKPAMRLDKDARDNGKSLRDRIKAFLPQLAAANEELEEARAAGTLGERNIENVDEGTDDAYIEMNLGLGVLEEKDPNASDMDSDSNDADEDGQSRAKEKDIMGKLLGHKRDGNGIQVLEERD